MDALSQFWALNGEIGLLFGWLEHTLQWARDLFEGQFTQGPLTAAQYISEPGFKVSDFDVQMSGIKFWKGDANLRPVLRLVYLKKQFYEILIG